MKQSRQLIGLLGICCTSLCMLGIPLLFALLGAAGLGKLQNERVMNAMLLMFLVMYAAGSYRAFSRHRRWGPVVLTLLGSGLLVGIVLMIFPKVVGWIALAVFVGSWVWDMLLLRGCPS